MIFDVVTIFPDFFASILEYGMLKRALEGGRAEVRLHDLRDSTDDAHRTVDDRPFGGGPGMVFKPEPVFRAVEAIQAEAAEETFPIILLSPQGRLLRQPLAEELARHSRLLLISGRYEGVDERVAEHLATNEISIGDYVLSGGELAAAVLIDAVTRLVPGVLGNEASRESESFASSMVASQADDKNAAFSAGATAGRHGLLDFPQYTRPAEFRGWPVPEVLLSGNHDEIRRWRRRRALEKTWLRRPELLEGFPLTGDDRRMLEDIKSARYAPADL